LEIVVEKKRILILSAVVALALACPAFATPKSSPSGRADDPGQQVSPALTNLLRENPQGGEALAAAIVHILAADPSTAGAIVALAKAASPDQKAAIALGILRVLHGAQTSPEAVRIIRAAIQSGDPVFRAVLAALESQIYAQGGQASEGRSGSMMPGGAGGGGFSSGSPGSRPTPTPVSPN